MNIICMNIIYMNVISYARNALKVMIKNNKTR
jgi:hypothetical protein